MLRVSVANERRHTHEDDRESDGEREAQSRPTKAISNPTAHFVEFHAIDRCMASASTARVTFGRRMRFIAVLGVTATIAGCSLLVSTSDLTGGTLDAGTSPDGASNSSSSGDSGTSGPPDGSMTSDAEAGSNVTELAGLVGKWTFEDGTPNDSSGKGRHGQLVGNSKITMTDRGNALRVQTDGHFVVEALNGGAFPKSGTISIWLQYVTMDQSSEESIFDSWANNRDHIFVRHANGEPIGKMQVAYQKSSDQYELATGFDVDPGRWSHVVITWDAAESYGRAYVDGKFGILGDNYPSGSFTPSGQLMSFGERLDGYIDDVRLFDRPLAEAEIFSLP